MRALRVGDSIRGGFCCLNSNMVQCPSLRDCGEMEFRACLDTRHTLKF